MREYTGKLYRICAVGKRRCVEILSRNRNSATKKVREMIGFKDERLTFKLLSKNKTIFR